MSVPIEIVRSTISDFYLDIMKHRKQGQGSTFHKKYTQAADAFHAKEAKRVADARLSVNLTAAVKAAKDRAKDRASGIRRTESKLHEPKGRDKAAWKAKEALRQAKMESKEPKTQQAQPPPPPPPPRQTAGAGAGVGSSSSSSKEREGEGDGDGKSERDDGSEQLPFIIDQRLNIQQIIDRCQWVKVTERIMLDVQRGGVTRRCEKVGVLVPEGSLGWIKGADEHAVVMKWFMYSNRVDAFVEKTRQELMSHKLYNDRDPDPITSCFACLKAIGTEAKLPGVVCPCGFGAWCSAICYVIDPSPHWNLCKLPVMQEHIKAGESELNEMVSKMKKAEEKNIANGMRRGPERRWYQLPRINQSCECGSCPILYDELYMRTVWFDHFNTEEERHMETLRDNARRIAEEEEARKASEDERKKNAAKKLTKFRAEMEETIQRNKKERRENPGTKYLLSLSPEEQVKALDKSNEQSAALRHAVVVAEDKKEMKAKELAIDQWKE